MRVAATIDGGWTVAINRWWSPITAIVAIVRTVARTIMPPVAALLPPIAAVTTIVVILNVLYIRR